MTESHPSPSAVDNFPLLESQLLLLRRFTIDDAPRVKELAGDEAIAATTFVPHPYHDGMAEEWIQKHRRAFDEGREITWAMTRRSDSLLIGSLSLFLDPDNFAAELGYWVGRPFWSQGYATEAAQSALDYAFCNLGLHRVFAHCMAVNPASVRVLEKIGMRCEGVLREALFRNGRFIDVLVYGILADTKTKNG